MFRVVSRPDHKNHILHIESSVQNKCLLFVRLHIDTISGMFVFKIHRIMQNKCISVYWASKNLEKNSSAHILNRNIYIKGNIAVGLSWCLHSDL